ncbi:MAG: hypothetical protein IJS29_05545 [Selenomonadaceae bacterium]|nr:hypothetical protein [Selenomonadaceae bacterium]
MKKRKRKKLRNNFTDALGEEISARENLNLDNLKKFESTPKVDLTKKVKPAEKVKPSSIETSNVEIANDKVADVKPVEVASKNSSVEIVEVKVDAEFEERVLAEANNDFLDDKPKRPRRMMSTEDIASSRSAFRAKLIQDRIAEEKELEIERKKNSDKNSDLRRNLTRAEMVGAAISAAMLAYSLSTYDKPLFFMAMSLLSHTLRPLIGGFFGKHNRSVQNALHGFSIVLFFGALLFIVI